MLHPTPVAGNHLSVQHSSVVGLIGQFFIVTDPAVLHAMEGGAYLDAAALTSLVAFLVSLGTDLRGQVYTSPQDLWRVGRHPRRWLRRIRYLSNLRSGAPHNTVHPDALLTLARILYEEHRHVVQCPNVLQTIAGRGLPQLIVLLVTCCNDAMSFGVKPA